MVGQRMTLADVDFLIGSSRERKVKAEQLKSRQSLTEGFWVQLSHSLDVE